VEHYISSCPDCEKSYAWVGRKCAFDEETAKKMKEEQTTCRLCGNKNIKTTLDWGDNASTESVKMVSNLLKGL